VTQARGVAAVTPASSGVGAATARRLATEEFALVRFQGDAERAAAVYQGVAEPAGVRGQRMNSPAGCPGGAAAKASRSRPSRLARYTAESAVCSRSSSSRPSAG
jgi:NAD(P)-dependent dehydrogenase (short-subunit alcohol dehydrogenase family)